MSKLVYSFFMAFILIIVSSCTKDDSDCLSQYSIKVFVKDINYSNIGNFPQLTPVSEGLPFRSYIGTIYYTLRDIGTGAVVDEAPVMAVAGDKTFYSLAFNNISKGEYELTVWGNLTPDVPAGTLHPNGKEHTDIFMGTDTLYFDSSYKKSELGLERTKGKLLVISTNFPSETGRIDEAISTVSQFVDPYLVYTGNGQVAKSQSFQNMVETFLAPSAGNVKSKLKLSYFSKDALSSLILTFPEIELAIHKNEITAVAVDYEKAEIWLFINGNWSNIIHPEID